MRCTCSEGIPVQGESTATRARPLSITAVTPSMVTELSATLVERITLRWSAGATARSCSAGERSPCSGRTRVEPPDAARRREPLGGFPPRPGGTPEHRRRGRLRAAARAHRPPVLRAARASAACTRWSDGAACPRSAAPGNRPDASRRAGVECRRHHDQLRPVRRADLKCRLNSASARSPSRCRS